MFDLGEAIIMEFPLKGEWLTPNTPRTRIPSHGTNNFGTRYAYDFIQVNWKKRGLPAYRASLARYLLFGLSISDYYCWGQEVYAPCDGTIVKAEDGFLEKKRTNLWMDMVNAYKNANFFDPRKDNVQSIAGNYIIIDCGRSIYAVLVHLQTGSIRVSTGQIVKRGEVVGRVGHSGNSFGPHLHFQLMDSYDITIANGLPCAFSRYEIFINGEWQEVYNGVPASKDRIRFK